MDKKIVPVIGAAALALCMVTGCGNSGSQQQTDTTTTAATTAAVTTEATTTTTTAAETTTTAATEAPAVETAATAGFTEKELKLFSMHEEDPKSLTVRFYDDMPSVPCVGIAQYKKLINGEELTVKADGGKLVLTAPDGSSVTADGAANTITSDNWAEFRNDEEGMKTVGKKVGFQDFGLPFAYIEDVEYEPQKETLVLDLGAYDIPVHTDETDAYIPLATLNNLLIDAAFNTLAYDGENLCLLRSYFEDAASVDPDYYKALTSETPRPDDMVKYAYNDLCFNFDVIYGNPGVAVLDPVVAEKGLDKALDETDEITAGIKELLLSPDPLEYHCGYLMLSNYFYDQHTYLADGALYLSYSKEQMEKVSEICQPINEAMAQKDYFPQMLAIGNGSYDIRGLRTETFGDEDSYHEKGDTAIILISDFMCFDEEGWKAHYNDGADIPDGKQVPDIVGSLITDLNRAKANPKIKNVVLDLASNGGGSSDIEATLQAILFGTAETRCYDKLTDRYFTIHYKIDSAFDGSFNTSAAFENYDFNYAVLTTKTSFSCGNLFPYHAKKAGLPTYGERSGGGSCMVRSIIGPMGRKGSFSVCFGTLVDDDGTPIEAGIPVDEELFKTSEEGVKDYSSLFDMKKLSKLINKYYSKEAAA